MLASPVGSGPSKLYNKLFGDKGTVVDRGAWISAAGWTPVHEGREGSAEVEVDANELAGVCKAHPPWLELLARLDVDGPRHSKSRFFVALDPA